MEIGYARVSTQDQNLDLQIDALNEAGCKKIYCDKISGSEKSRPELDRMIESLRKGDTVVVFKLDRLGRSLKHLIDLVAQFDKKGVSFKSTQDMMFDTTSSQGRLIFNLFASLAEFERDIIRERTNAGLKSARARGRIGGRPKGLSEEAQKTAEICASLYEGGKHGANEIATRMRISKATLYKYLRQQNVEIGVRSVS